VMYRIVFLQPEPIRAGTISEGSANATRTGSPCLSPISRTPGAGFRHSNWDCWRSASRSSSRSRSRC